MTFFIGRGFAKLQILKKWKWPNWVDYYDETLHTHWHWQDVAQEIVKYNLGLAEALPSFLKLVLNNAVLKGWKAAIRFWSEKDKDR